MTKPRSSKKETKHDSSVEDRLSAIYRDDQGDLPDFDQFERRRSFWWLRTTVWMVFAACVVCICAWLGFMLWRPWRADGPPAIALHIEAPKEISLGKEETLRIQWENTQLQPVREASIRVFLPTDFVLQSASPRATDASSTIWNLGLLPPQQKGQIELHGVFYGSSDRQATLQALATYHPDALDRERQLAETIRLAYTTSTVGGSLVVPERMLPGDQVAFRYQVTNRSDQELGPLMARFTLPEGFVVSASSSQGLHQDGQLLTLPITRLPAGSMTTLQVTGSMLAGHPGDALIVAAVGRADVRGAFVSLEQTEARSVVLAGDLALRMIVNGSASEAPIEPGAPLRVTFGYENTSGEILKDVSLTLASESVVNGKKQTGPNSLVQWSLLEDVQRAASSTKGQTQTLKLSSLQVPSLGSLPPGAKGSFDWILPLRSAPTSSKEAVVQLTASAHIDRVGSALGARDVRTTPLNLRYKTDADLAVEARYATEEGAPLGTGPLPPQVGKTTSYRVSWVITKKTHELDQITVRAKLPAIAVWSKNVQVEKGSLTFDEATREVRWTIPAFLLDATRRAASFEVQVTPERADVGRFAPLLGETAFEAHDKQLGTQISRLKPALTTDLPDDPLAGGRGVVR